MFAAREMKKQTRGLAPSAAGGEPTVRIGTVDKIVPIVVLPVVAFLVRPARLVAIAPGVCEVGSAVETSEQDRPSPVRVVDEGLIEACAVDVDVHAPIRMMIVVDVAL